LLAPVLAVALLAGVSLEAGAYGNKGIISLKLGQAGVADGFYYLNPDGTSTGHFQRFAVRSKCLVDNGGWILDSMSGGPGKLVNLQPVGPIGSSRPTAGLENGSLGVYDNGKGTSCTRMTASIEEELFFESLVGGFDRLELDLELKGNAVFEVEIVGGNTYTLRSGTARIPGGWEGEADTDHPIVNCTGSSDSGPDSGPNDNCTWVINDIGSAFYLRPVAGEGSLEGGGDYPTGAVDSRIYLTSLIDVGTLGCDLTNNKTAMVFADAESEGAASCQVTRIGPPYAGVSSCDLINYRLATFTAESLCRLDKTGLIDANGNGEPDEQIAGSLKVTFKPEEKPADWYGIEPTVIQFADDEDFLAYRCGGTIEPDQLGNLTVKEVLTTGLSGVMVNGQFVARPAETGETTVTLSDSFDALRGNGAIDWACVYETRDVYQGAEKIQVEQTILFWGDISFSRTGVRD
jgi:hypothetical protein